MLRAIELESAMQRIEELKRILQGKHSKSSRILETLGMEVELELLQIKRMLMESKT